VSAEGLLVLALFYGTQNVPIGDGQYREASRYASLALFEQSGLKVLADKERKSYTGVYKRNVPNEVQTALAWTAFIARTAEDRKITFSWTF
jgi:hypothetical protein